MCTLAGRKIKRGTCIFLQYMNNARLVTGRDDIRRIGVACDRAEREPAIICIAAPRQNGWTISGYFAVQPPSIEILAPVMDFAASEHR